MLEKIMLIFILLIGISQFSLIVAEFNGLVSEFDKMNAGDTKIDELIAWMSSIDAVQNHIPPALKAKIIKHFEYYWEHDRLRGLALEWWQSETCDDLIAHQDEYMTLLPKGFKEAILNHLFSDFGVKFAVFFRKNTDLRLDLTPHFQPRLYHPGQYIVQKGQPVEEIVFVTKGEVTCGIDCDTGFQAVLSFQHGAIIGDAEVLLHKSAIASFKVTGSHAVHGYILPARPVQMLLEEKYRVAQAQMLIYSGKINYIAAALDKYGKVEVKKRSIYEEIAEKLANKSKQEEVEVRNYTEADVKDKIEELKRLEWDLKEAELEREQVRSALIMEVLQQAA